MTDNFRKYVTSFRDRHGKRRYYFRYRQQKFKLPGKPGSVEYHEAYARYLADAKSGALGRDNVASSMAPSDGSSKNISAMSME